MPPARSCPDPVVGPPIEGGHEAANRGDRGSPREDFLHSTIILSDLKVISNWIIGGFALGIIQGEVDYNGRKQIIYGLAELLI